MINPLPFPEDRAIAVKSPEITLSYLDLRRRLAHLQETYRTAGIAAGDQVGLYLRSSLDLLLHYLALWEYGATLVVMDHQTKGGRLDDLLAAVDLKWCLTDTALAMGRSVWEEGQTLYRLQEAHRNPLQERFRRSPGQILLFTSGSEGLPKPVVLAKERVLRNADKVRQYTGLTRRDATLLTLPLSYSYAMSQCLAHLLTGARVHLMSFGFLLDAILGEFASWKLTNFAATPYFYELLHRRLEVNENGHRELKTARFLMNAGGFLSPDTIQCLAKKLPWVTFFNNYGQTEASPRLTYQPFTHRSLSFTGVGRPLPGVQVRISDPDERGIGMICYQSEDSMLGYYHDPQLGSSPQWVATGDLGYLDGEDNLVIVGRADSMIKVNGRKCFLNHVESRILSLGHARHVKVVKWHHECHGEYLCAYVVPSQWPEKPKCFEKTLMGLMRDILDPMTCPKRLVLVQDFHLLSNGKVDKSALEVA